MSFGHASGVRVDGTSSLCDCPTACGGEGGTQYQRGKGFLRFLSLTRLRREGVVAASPQILKNAFLSSLLLAHPHSGVGGERSEPITRMRIMPYDTES